MAKLKFNRSIRIGTDLYPKGPTFHEVDDEVLDNWFVKCLIQAGDIQSDTPVDDEPVLSPKKEAKAKKEAEVKAKKEAYFAAKAAAAKAAAPKAAAGKAAASKSAE